MQVAADQHAETVPGFLRLCPHSCRPNMVHDLDTRRIEVLVDVQPGDELTFFHPSTEWDMAAPFECSCGAPICLGRIAGAKHIPRGVLRGYGLARQIRELRERTT